MGIQKVRTESTVLTSSTMAWLGKWFLFQTFEEVDSINNKEDDAQLTYHLVENKYKTNKPQ